MASSPSSSPCSILEALLPTESGILALKDGCLAVDGWPWLTYLSLFLYSSFVLNDLIVSLMNPEKELTDSTHQVTEFVHSHGKRVFALARLSIVLVDELQVFQPNRSSEQRVKL